MLEPHALDPHKVLRLARSLGAPPTRVLLVGCEPRLPESDDFAMEMSEPVKAAVDEAIELVESLISQIRAEQPARAT